jgi:prolyl 4-hydroxylase
MAADVARAGINPDGPSSRRAAMGRIVCEKLDLAPKVGRIECDGFDIFYGYDFVTPEECAELIAMVDRDCHPSEVVSTSSDASKLRTSDSGDVNRFDPLIQRLDQRICTLMGLHQRQGETMQGQRYRVGQKFDLHFDYFSLARGYWPDHMQAGGQRTWTAMIYLNQPEAGGNTLFRDAGFALQPVPGLVVIWNNMQADGSPNPKSIHAGQPVEAGVKYVVTKWFREGYWI